MEGMAQRLPKESLPPPGNIPTESGALITTDELRAHATITQGSEFTYDRHRVWKRGVRSYLCTDVIVYVEKSNEMYKTTVKNNNYVCQYCKIQSQFIKSF